jgi:hypothetical protein
VADAFEPPLVATFNVNEVRVLVWRLIRRELDLDLILAEDEAAVGAVSSRAGPNDPCLASGKPASAASSGVR